MICERKKFSSSSRLRKGERDVRQRLMVSVIGLRRRVSMGVEDGFGRVTAEMAERPIQGWPASRALKSRIWRARVKL
jgi:hypothetical protein